MTPILEQLVQCALAAGTAIQEVAVQSDRGVRLKSAGDPVTAADHISDALLRALLPKIVPAAWLSEESSDDRRRLLCDQVWIVDPLDGTKEFVAQVAQYAVSIALVRNNIPVIGVVHNPATGECFAAERGSGAWTTEGNRLRVAEGITLLGSRSEIKSGEFAAFEGWKVEAVGSIAYKLGLVASGHGAVTISRGPKWEWDVAAGALIVEEAGGRVCDADGNPYRLNQPHPKVRGVIAGAPLAVQSAIDRIAVIGMSDRMAELERHPGDQ